MAYYVGQQTFVRPPPNPSISLPGPGRSEDTTKRRLLLIYIHGFQGSETTFQELPKHVHGLVTDLLIESHVVYTRIYPRYKSQGELQTAVNQFSAWLAPHQADDLDVILIGHSIGGILAADVALLQENQRPKHRILGLMAYDTPYLGLHPRIIPDGIKSFWPQKDAAPEEEIAKEEEALGMEPAYIPPAPIPKSTNLNANFDRPWRNDKRQSERGLLEGMKHFVHKKKHEEHFVKSALDRILSPAKFANCVNNYSELRRRYQCIKQRESSEFSPHRMRFINYYTSSTGRPKAKKSKSEDKSVSSTPPLEGSQTPSISESYEGTNAAMSSLSLAETSSFSVDQTRDLALSESMSHSTSHSTTESGSKSKDAKPKKAQKFILLPSHHWKTDDNANWEPVVMKDIDAVVAHQSMFLPTGAHYDFLVGDTVAVIEKWVQDDLSRRVVQQSSNY